MSYLSRFFSDPAPSAKVGRVRRCPHCGETVPASAVTCPTCGWEFDESLDAGSALQMLADQIANSHSFSLSNLRAGFRSEKDIVHSYAIPKTKNALLELTLFFRSKSRGKLSTDFDKSLRNEYRIKYEECISKIQMYYSGDRAFDGIMKQYKKDRNSIKILILVLVIVLLGAAAAVYLFLK